jgi:REP element-mobilizing transposase RayT
VTVRGNEKRTIFLDDEDRRDYLERLASVLPHERCTCYAWALMPNHVHLVLRTDAERSLSRSMARVGTGYVGRFNRRYGRVGHLFQNRFHSVSIAHESHLSAAVRYVHMNPLRARLVGSVADLERYPWTGHAALMGRLPCSFLAVDQVLGWFCADERAARAALRRWMEAAAQPGPDFEGEGHRRSEPASHPQAIASGWDFARLMAWVCAKTGADPARVLGRSRTPVASLARAIGAHFAQAALGLQTTEVARRLGVGVGSASRAIARGRAQAGALGLVLPESPDVE